MKKIEGSEATATVKKNKAKDGELPGMTQNDRKIQEIEDLGDELSDLEDEASAIREKVKDANENLVAAMKRRERTYYSRPSWGSVTIAETKLSAKVKKATSASDSGDE